MSFLTLQNFKLSSPQGPILHPTQPPQCQRRWPSCFCPSQPFPSNATTIPPCTLVANATAAHRVTTTHIVYHATPPPCPCHLPPPDSAVCTVRTVHALPCTSPLPLLPDHVQQLTNRSSHMSRHSVACSLPASSTHCSPFVAHLCILDHYVVLLVHSRVHCK